MACKVRNRLFVLLCIASALLSIGCGHINKLSTVKFKTSVVYSEYKIIGDAARGVVCIGNELANPIINDSSKGVMRSVINSVGTIGSAIATSSVESKIARSVSPDSLAWSVASAFERSLEMYAAIVPVLSLDEKPDFIAETLLERYELSSTQSGVFAKVSITTRIIERGTGTLIWENSESKTIGLSNLSPAGVHTPIGRRIGGIMNMIQILSMSPENVRGVLLAAATEAGRKMGETFREDISE